MQLDHLRLLLAWLAPEPVPLTLLTVNCFANDSS
jgi:hypothetical protein